MSVQTIKLLIANDCDQLATYLQRHLLMEFNNEISVEIAMNKEMAIRILRENGPFDLVVADLCMPEEKDGLDLLSLIRTGATESTPNGTNRDVPIGLVTGLGDYAAALVEGFGLSFILHSPFMPSEFTRCIRTFPQFSRQQ